MIGLIEPIPPTHTQQCVAVADHLRGMAESFELSATVGQKMRAKGEEINPWVVRGSFDDINELLIESFEQRGNFEPEMFEAVESLQRQKEAFFEMIE